MSGPIPSKSYDAPGFLTDLSDNAKAIWSTWIAANVRSYVHPTDPEDANTQWFCALDVDPTTQFASQVIDWQAFPRQVLLKYGDVPKRFEVADSDRKYQDEYLEWSVTRDPKTNKITRVTFTSEGPEYWKTVAKDSTAKLLSLYQQLVSPDVQLSDLLDGNGKYNPTNKWNNSTTNGAVHLIQVNNTLGAEINLGARATVVRTSGGSIITDAQQLIKCSGYGNPNRNSDPHIGDLVNTLARAGYLLTIANPIALYISSFEPIGFICPDSSDAADYWTITRGTADHALRAVFEVPESKGFTVSDIQTSPGQFINYASQLTDFIRVKLTGIAIDKDPSRVKPLPCPGSLARSAVAEASPASGPAPRNAFGVKKAQRH